MNSKTSRTDAAAVAAVAAAVQAMSMTMTIAACLFVRLPAAL